MNQGIDKRAVSHWICALEFLANLERIILVGVDPICTTGNFRVFFFFFFAVFDNDGDVGLSFAGVCFVVFVYYTVFICFVNHCSSCAFVFVLFMFMFVCMLFVVLGNL